MRRIMFAVAVPFVLAGATLAQEKVTWFNGTFDEALASAKANQKRVFLYFWANQSKQCVQQYGTTLKDDKCCKLLLDYIVFSADTTTPAGSKLVERYNVKSLPTMLILESDGTAEDALVGYCPPKNFVEELERIKKGIRTVSFCRKQAEQEPENLELRYKYAELLRHVGNFKGYEKVCNEIRKADPKGETLTGAYFLYGDIKKKIRDACEDMSEANVKPLVGFLKKTKFEDILWEGWSWIGWVELEREKRNKARKAFQTAWEHCPESRILDFGGELSKVYWKMRDQLRTADKKFIVEVGEEQARRAEELRQPKADDAGLRYVGKNFEAFLAKRLDILACCYYLAGKRKLAMTTIQKCAKLDPKNEHYPKRLAQFKEGQ